MGEDKEITKIRVELHRSEGEEWNPNLIVLLLVLQASLLHVSHSLEQFRVLVVDLRQRLPQPHLLRQIVETGERYRV